MYEKYIIVEGPTRNVVENGQATGFQVGVRVPYYRGLGLSMIEDIQLSVDDKAIPSDKIRVELHGNTYTLAEMEKEGTDRWEFGEVGTVKVLQSGGLTPGKHKFDLLFNLRISYMPFNAMRKDSKTLTV